MSITFSLRNLDGTMACKVNHGAGCEVAEHLLDEYAHPYEGYCVPCSMDNRDACPVCSRDINVSNTNAQMILERLGVEFDYCGEIQASDLLGRAMTANVGRDDSGIAATEDRAEGRATIIECGLPAGYFDDRMEGLTNLALAALASGLMVVWG